MQEAQDDLYAAFLRGEEIPAEKCSLSLIVKIRQHPRMYTMRDTYRIKEPEHQRK